MGSELKRWIFAAKDVPEKPQPMIAILRGVFLFLSKADLITFFVRTMVTYGSKCIGYVRMSRWRENYKHILSFPKAFWVVIIATLCNQIGNMAVVFLLLYLTQYLHFSLTAASCIFALFSGSMFVTGLYGGSLIDRIGGVKAMLMSLLANGFILIIFPWFHGFFILSVLAILWGLTYGLYRPASQVIVSVLSPEGSYKLTFSVYRLAMNLGMSIGPALGGYLAVYSYPAIFVMNGIANVLACVVLILGLDKTLRQQTKKPASKFELNLKFLREDQALKIFVLGMVLLSLVFFQHESTLAIFMTDNLHLPVSLYGWLFTINTLMIVFFELPLNVATLNWPYRVNFIAGGAFITLGFAGLMFASQSWHIMLLAVSWTIGEMLFYPSATSYIAEIAPLEKRGSYMALYSTCSNIGMLFGPLLGALLMQYVSANGLWIGCGFAGIISMLTFTQLRLKPRQH